MYILVFILGIIIGSFLNVCIYRIPREESIVFPSSHCTYCSHTLAWYDLIPMLSFLSLRGKCRYCGGDISPQYPIIEILNGIFYIFTFYYFGFTLEALFYSLIINILLVITVIDFNEQIIPDGLVLSIFIITVAYRFTAYFLFETPIYLWNSLLSLLSGGLLFFIIAVASNGGMGGGDIKLIAVLGFIQGLKKTLLNILLSFLIGAFVSIILLLLKKKGRKDAIAFGPFINIAFIITLFFGDLIIIWYISNFL